MAEFLTHTDGHNRFSISLGGSFLPSATAPKHQSPLDATKPDPTKTSTEGNASAETPFSEEKPLNGEDGCAFQDFSAFFVDPQPQLRAYFSRFAHPHDIAAFPNSQSKADCAAFSLPDSSSKGQQMLYESSRVEYMPSAERVSHEEQACAGCAPTSTIFQDSHMQSSTASVHSCEESTSLHEKGGDSTEPVGSHKNFMLSHDGYEDGCNNNERFTCTKDMRRDATNDYDGAGYPLEEPLDPDFLQLGAHATNSQQPCLSECSSSVSMVTDASSEATSRLDNIYRSVDGKKDHWTDAKHGSYLDYMETEFVNNLFRREYCALDVCGQGPFHEGSNRASIFPSTRSEFKSWHSGDWHWRSLLQPPLLTCIPLSLHKSPWVNHFRYYKSSQATHVIKGENVSTCCPIDGEDEVNSPSTNLHRRNLGHLHASRRGTGREEKFFFKNRNSGSKALGMSKQNVVHEFDVTAESPSFSKTKKRGLETDIESELRR